MRKWLFILPAALAASCSTDRSEAPEKTKAQPVVTSPAMQDPSATSSAAIPEKKLPAKSESHVAKPDNAVEEELMSRIMQLDEIKKQDKQLRKETNGKKSLRALVSRRPSDDTEYYAIAVAQNSDEAATTLYTFHVYPDQTILFYDPVTDLEMTLKAWEKTVR